MEFDNRIVEHLLLPTGRKSQGWVSTFEQPQTDNAPTTLSTLEVLDYLEYAWAASVGTGGQWFKTDWFLEPTAPAFKHSFPIHAAIAPAKRTKTGVNVRSPAEQLAVIKG